MFAAIMARLMGDIALYRSERGIRLGTLEQLVQSASLASSVKAAFVLRNRTLSGILIVIVWCFSPIGGQSSLRCFSEVDALITHNVTLMYATGNSIPYVPYTSDIVQNTLRAAILAPNTTKSGTTDSWQNVKAPFMRQILDTDVPGEKLYDWHGFRGNRSDDYASLIGIPMWNLPSPGNVSFTIPWSYMYTDCRDTPGGWGALCNGTDVANVTTEESTPSYCRTDKDNGTFSPPYLKEKLGLWNIDWNHIYLNATDQAALVKLRLFTNCEYEEYVWDDIIKNYTYREKGVCASVKECDIRSVRMDINLTCIDGVCETLAARRSLIDQRPTFITPWNEWLNVSFGARLRDVVTLTSLMENWPQTSEMGRFLSGSNQPEIVNNDYTLKSTSNPILSLRLTQFLNSYWLSFAYSLEIVSSGRNPPTLYGTNGDGFGAERIFYKELPAEAFTKIRVYRAHTTWVVFLTYISLTLIMCSVASIIMRHKTISPDMLGYASSLTRDSSYFEHCQVGSGLGGLERARALQDLRVYIADVKPHMKVGRIAFSTGITEGMPHGRLSRDRQYE